MATLNYNEQQTIEKLLKMDQGYVSDFSDRTFKLFMGDFFNIDIYDSKYVDLGTSKAKRLRTFIKKESDYIVSVALEGLLNNQIALDSEADDIRTSLYATTTQIISRLKNSSPVENLSSIRAIDSDTNFTLLSESVRRSIENHNPVEALDRLHTYMVRYSRKLCEKYSITFDHSIALNGLFGMYVKYLRENEIISSNMTFEILGAYTKILDKYNNVRNNESFAHDNDLVNDSEALLILNSVANLIRFVDELERNQTN